jgi:hypothetical protein
VLAVVLALFFTSTAMAGTFTPKAGNYYVHKTQNVTFHTYTTPTAFGASASVVIETPNKLIVQDVQQNKTNNLELLALIDSLKKPVDRIYISHNHDHHWAGLAMYPGIPVYASDTTIAGIEKEGAAALAGLKEKFGEAEVPYTKVVVPSQVQNPGVTVIDGVKILFGTPMMTLTGPVTFMEFPDQKVLIHHHLAYVDVHVPMPPAGMRAVALEELKQKGYDYFIGGHGTPCEADRYFSETIGYFTRLDQVVKNAATPAAAVESMKKAYPQWGAVFLLEAIMPANFKK